MMIEFKGKGYATEANALRHITKHTPMEGSKPMVGYRFMVAAQGGRFHPVVLLVEATRWRLGYYIHNGFYTIA